MFYYYLVASNDLLVAKQVALLFDNPIFRTELSTDVSTVEFCGALKNIVSIGAGSFYYIKLI